MAESIYLPNFLATLKQVIHLTITQPTTPTILHIRDRKITADRHVTNTHSSTVTTLTTQGIELPTSASIALCNDCC